MIKQQFREGNKQTKAYQKDEKIHKYKRHGKEKNKYQKQINKQKHSNKKKRKEK